MLDKKTIQNRIKQNLPLIRRHGISKVGLFGSYARNEQTKGSDIDILIDFQEGQETFDNYIAAYALFEQIFKGQKVELVTLNGLSPFIGPYILSELEYVETAN